MNYAEGIPESFSGRAGMMIYINRKGTRLNCLNIAAILLNAIRNRLLILVVLQMVRIN
jgi:hypothetical protein